jgi:hypothetical protein
MSVPESKASVVINEEHVAIADLSKNSWRVSNQSDVIRIP